MESHIFEGVNGNTWVNVLETRDLSDYDLEKTGTKTWVCLEDVIALLRNPGPYVDPAELDAFAYLLEKGIIDGS